MKIRLILAAAVVLGAAFTDDAQATPVPALSVAALVQGADVIFVGVVARDVSPENDGNRN